MNLNVYDTVERKQDDARTRLSLSELRAALEAILSERPVNAQDKEELEFIAWEIRQEINLRLNK